jgi:hypothetical protein
LEGHQHTLGGNTPDAVALRVVQGEQERGFGIGTKRI